MIRLAQQGCLLVAGPLLRTLDGAEGLLDLSLSP